MTSISKHKTLQKERYTERAQLCDMQNDTGHDTETQRRSRRSKAHVGRRRERRMRARLVGGRKRGWLARPLGLDRGTQVFTSGTAQVPDQRQKSSEAPGMTRRELFCD